jgi:large subunit ribosomal protein L13
MQTFSVTPKDVERKWYIVDATDKVLGRLASEISQVLRGKRKTYFAPHLDTGDFVIVVNAEKVKLTGKKTEQKQYFRHSGFPGGSKTVRLDKLLRTHPERVIMRAVKGMIPHNRLGRSQLTKLKVYAGPSHPHQAQQPEDMKI